MGPLVQHVVNHPLLVGALVVLAIAVAVYELRHRSAGGAAFGVSAASAVRLINKGAMVVDVREQEAYAKGHIVNAKNVALDRLTQERTITKKQKNKVFVTVCDNGAQSGRGASALRKAGFENAFNIKGGLKEWRENNLPLVKSK